jgi:rare lipoprotein A
MTGTAARVAPRRKRRAYSAAILPARPMRDALRTAASNLAAARRGAAQCAVLAAAALLAACASGPPSRPGRDGPGANPPADLAQRPDAEPRVEPLRSGGPNKPYEVLGRRYVPVTDDRPMRETGLASWYGRKFDGLPTSSGERYDMYAMTAAHKTMPIPSYARVRNPANGREVIVRVNDRGPFAPGRIIDLSYAAAFKLGLLGGVAPVEVERLTNDEIRAGTWRHDAAPPAAPAPPGPEDDPLMALARTAMREPAPAVPTTAAPGYWLQLGAFSQREGAAALNRRVQREADWLAPLLAVFDDRATWRVQAGPYATRDEALGVAERLRSLLSLSALLVERR